MANLPRPTESTPTERAQNDAWPEAQLRRLGLTFADQPVAMFRYVVDDQWLSVLQARQKQVAPSPLSRAIGALMIVAVVQVLGFGALLYSRVIPFLDPLLIGAVVVNLLVLALYGGLRLYLRQIYRSSKSYKATETFALHREGIVGHDRHSCSARRWEAYSSAARFPDGFLLSMKTSSEWLPLTGLTAGSAEEVAAVLRAGIADYKEVRA